MLLAFAAALCPQQPAVTTIQVPAHVVVTGTLRTDVDGDGRDDLVLACRDTDSKRRELRLHRRRAEGLPFDNTPTLPPYVLERDVIAFTFADVTAAPGRELVLLTAERAVAVGRDADGTATYHPLFAPRLVWPAADPDFVLPLPGARCDVDGDGRDDLLLPQPDGAVLWRAAAAVPFELTLPPRRSPLAGRGKGPVAGNGPATLSGDELRLRFSLGGDDGDERDDGPLVRLRATAPPCRSLDLDGDGRLDLAAVRNGRLFAAMQQADGAFARREVALPLPADRLSLFDPSFDVQCADLGGDGRAELLVTTSASRDDAIEVRIDVFATGADGGWLPQANGRLRVQPLAQPPQLVDADGDGRLDLVLVTVRTDMLRGLTGEGPQALDAQLAIFRGTGDRFAVPAMLQAALRLPANGDGGNTPFVHVVGGDLLVREENVLQRRPLRRDGDRLLLQPAAVSFALPQGARLEPLLAPGTEVLVRTAHEVLWVDLR
ncbi:MAG: VCBS repeat-containing protein [Planctomycetes bacterium]|nr:VCBS repeat-containing protein [Planctomycetota bacterium]